VVQAMKEHREEMEAESRDMSPDALVFTSTHGTYLRKGNFLRRQFAPLITRAKVRRIGFHGIRHSHATLLLDAGISVNVVTDRPRA